MRVVRPLKGHTGFVAIKNLGMGKSVKRKVQSSKTSSSMQRFTNRLKPRDLKLMSGVDEVLLEVMEKFE